MAASYKIFKEIRLVIVTCSGPANLKEVVDMITRLQTDADYSKTYDILWDATRRTVPFSWDEIGELVRHVHIYKGNKRPKRAFLVSKDVNYGMAKVYEGFHSGRSKVDNKIFKDKSEALKWLGLHDHPLFCTNNCSN
jgi:hypothetical protein